MVNCCVPQCVSNPITYILLSFHKFPKDISKKKLWEKLCRNDNLVKNPYVCNLHFKGGVKTYDIHTPSVFPWTREWKSVIDKYNEGVTLWFRGQKQFDHDYTKVPNVMPYNAVKHGSKQANSRTSKNSTVGRVQVLYTNL